ncbi:unnamed protein product [Trichobilharzia szidati]|nr:unnamed protein product [Trichobilharzia szidati]
MLDWDDLVCDVLDDREMVTAHFSIATLANNPIDSCPFRSTAGVDSIFPTLSTPLVIDLCSDNGTGPSLRSTLQPNGVRGTGDNVTNFASVCDSGLEQTDTNGHIANRILRVGDRSTSSSNLSLNLSNDSCGMHQQSGVQTSHFTCDSHEWLLNNDSFKDSSSGIHSSNNSNCITTSSSDNRRQCFPSLTTHSPSQPTSVCCNPPLSNTCEHPKNPLVPCSIPCNNNNRIIDNNTTNPHQLSKTTFPPNVAEMLSNVLSRRRDLIESGWDSDDEDEDLGDPDGGYSYDGQLAEQTNELSSSPKIDAVVHSGVKHNSCDLPINSSLSIGNRYCSESVNDNNNNSQLHVNTNNNFSIVQHQPTVNTPNISCEKLGAQSTPLNADIWPLPPPPPPPPPPPSTLCPSDSEHFDASIRKYQPRAYSPLDEYHIGINTERLIRAVQSQNSSASLDEFTRIFATSEQLDCTSVCDLGSTSLNNSSTQIPNLSYSQPNLITPCEGVIQQHNTQDLSNTSITTNSTINSCLNQPKIDNLPNFVQFNPPHVVCTNNSTKPLISPNRPVNASCSRPITRLGAAFQANLTVPTIVEEEEEYSIDSERRLPNLSENKTHLPIDKLLQSTNISLHNDNADINDTVEEDYPLLRKDYILEKDQKTSEKQFPTLHVNTASECNTNSDELIRLSDFHIHSNDNPPFITHRSSRGLPTPDVLRWLEDTRDATMNCTTDSKSNLSHLSSSGSLNQSDSISTDRQKQQQNYDKSEKISFNGNDSLSINKSQESLNTKDTILIRLVNTKRGENLGIQIKPVFSEIIDTNNSDNYSDENMGSRIECGLEVHNVLPNGRVAREQCLSVGDRILSINGISLSGIPFEKGRDIFQAALNEPEIILRVLPRSAYQYSSPTMSIQSRDSVQKTTEKSEKPSCGLIFVVTDPTSKGKECEAKCNIVSQLKPVPPPPPRRSPNTVLTRIPEGIIKPLIDEFLQEKKQREEQEAAAAAAATTHHQHTLLNNTQSSNHPVEKSIKSMSSSQNENNPQFSTHTIRLCKGSNGLGFSLTSREVTSSSNDNTTSTTTSNQKIICVKNILPGGAALTDGHLKPGDVLIKVDDIYVNEIGQAQTVALLRSKPVNTVVTLVVNRFEQSDPNPSNNNNNNSSHICVPDLKAIQSSVVCTISSSCCINTINTSINPNEQSTMLAVSSVSSSLSSISQAPMTQQHEKVIVEQPSSYDIKLSNKLSEECSCNSQDTSQEFHPLPASHPFYKLHEIDSSHWSLYIFVIQLPMSKLNNNYNNTEQNSSSTSSSSVTVQPTESITPQSLQSNTMKRSTGNPATLGVSVSVRKLNHNRINGSGDIGGGGVDGRRTDEKMDHALDSQWNAVFVRTVITGGPAHQDGRLQVGDRLLTIDGQPLSGLSTSDALNRLKSVIAKNLNEYHPCVHLLIARRRCHKLTNSDDSYANSVEDTSENSTHSKMAIPHHHQHKSTSELTKKKSYGGSSGGDGDNKDNDHQSNLLIVSAVVHSSESMTTGNVQDTFDRNTKCTLSSSSSTAAACTSTDSSSLSSMAAVSSSHHHRQQKQSHLDMDKISQTNKDALRSSQANSSHTSHHSRGGSHKNALKNSSTLCNTKKLCKTSNHTTSTTTTTTSPCTSLSDNTCSTAITGVNSPPPNKSKNNVHCDSVCTKKNTVNNCSVNNVRSPINCSTNDHLDFMCKSDNTHCTDGHKNKNNLNNCINSKCCYNNDDRLDQNNNNSNKKRISNYSSSSTEMLYSYQNLSNQHSIDECCNDSVYCHYLPTDDSDFNYDATLSDPETERYYYKLDSLSDSNISSVSSKLITPTPTPMPTTTATATTNTHKEGSRTRLTSHTCRTHCKYSLHNSSSSNSSHKCKYRVVYRQPRIDFSQMVLVPFDPSAWNGPVLKPRTALNSEELKLLIDTPKLAVSSSGINGGVGGESSSSNNTLIQDENIQRREDNKMMTCGGAGSGSQALFSPKDQNSVSDSDDGYKQNSKCVNNETARLRKTSHPKTVIGKLFSLVKPTTHRRANDQNTTTNSEQAVGWQNCTDNNLEASLPRGHLVNTLAKDKTMKDAVISNQNHYSRTQNNIVVHQDNSGNNLIKPQSNLSNDIHFSTNNKAQQTSTNSHVEMSSSSSPPSSSSHPSCYAKLHERLDPPIHIYDTAHNIQASINDSSNDTNKNPCSPPDEQINIDVRYSSQMFKLTPEKDVNKTLSISAVMNENDTVKLPTPTATVAAAASATVTAIATVATTTTKYADLTFLPNSSTLKTNIPLPSSSIPSSVTGNAVDQKTATTRINKTGKDSMGSNSQHHEQHQQQQQSHQLHRSNQPYFNSLSKSTVNRLYDIEISSCSTAYESVMEFVPNCDDNASKPKTTREVYEDAEALYRHLSDLKQQHHQQQQHYSSNSDIQTTTPDSSSSLHQHP